MKKIKVPHDNKSRVICVNSPGKLDFWYQPADSAKRYWLMEHPFSGSIYAYFRDYGRKMNSPGFSLTLGEVYRFRKHNSVRLNRADGAAPWQGGPCCPQCHAVVRI